MQSMFSDGIYLNQQSITENVLENPQIVRKLNITLLNPWMIKKLITERESILNGMKMKTHQNLQYVAKAELMKIIIEEMSTLEMKKSQVSYLSLQMKQLETKEQAISQKK